ncbi:M14 family metallopeptidase [Bacillus sp. 1NLA3E]|uniref:M14 family metallopeptidase n=1 Tax=Bacillus sp. 1NLA3E TaxID=666686 RepID=UPI000247E712|nr:M14 family metallopeptidase [Bacillus sp. 1NLA3E]AGK54911.1 gamma-D-glutamyl-L-diamino acid endopeptidase [Bacillus sp. 1NLA3E]
MKVRIRSGDSLWYFSQMFMVPLNLIIDSNPLVNPQSLVEGQMVDIPGFIKLEYKVNQGDTCWKLAHTRNLSADAIVLLNPSINPNQLAIGETIWLPKRVMKPIVNGKRKYDFLTMLGEINELSKIYPFIRVNSIGDSVLGNPLKEIRIGKGYKKININASFHANEWITTSIAMTFLNIYLLSLTNGQSLDGVRLLPFYHEIELSIVPMVNPDGVNLVLNGPPESHTRDIVKMNNGSSDFTAWKANIRGVDLNNQFPANWEIEKERKEPKAPASRDYPGEAPLTEPEAIAMAKLVRDSGFDCLIALHTQGEEFYWGYEGLEPPDSAVLAEEFERVSGYKAICYVDSHAGFKDWFIQECRKPGFTLELGKGINPLPLSQFDKIFQRVAPIFWAALNMKKQKFV